MAIPSSPISRLYESTRSIPLNRSFLHIFLFFFTLVSLCIQPAHAGPNVTVDDTDPRIVYTGFWERTPNFEENSAGGGHVTTFSDPTASVTFTFRGTAVYLTYPLWPYKVSSGWVSLDGLAPVRISLQDLNHTASEGGSATARSSIMYIAEGLNPELEHTIRVTAAQAADEFVVFDMLMYTELDGISTVLPTTEAAPTIPAPEQSLTTTRPPLSSNPSPTLSLPSTTSSVSRSSASTSVASRAAAQSQTQTVTIAACIVAGALALLAIPLIMFLCKRRRQRKEQDQWKQDALASYNAAYNTAESGVSRTPIYTAHTTFHTAPTTFPQTPGTFSSFGTTGFVVPSPTTLEPTYRRRQSSKDELTSQNDPYMDQIRRDHSHMVAAKSSMASMAAPAAPPPAAPASRHAAPRTYPQPRGRDHELALPVSPRRRSASARRQQSGDSGLSYVSEGPGTTRPASQILRPMPSEVETYSQGVGPMDRERELELEAQRKEREHRERLKLRIRNARSTMMTVNTVSLPPAYEDPSYAAPPPVPPQAQSITPQARQAASGSSPGTGGPSSAAQGKGRRHASRRVTQFSALQNPWDDPYGGLSRSAEDDIDGKTLIGTVSPMREIPPGGPGSFVKPHLHTLAPASG